MAGCVAQQSGPTASVDTGTMGTSDSGSSSTGSTSAADGGTTTDTSSPDPTDGQSTGDDPSSGSSGSEDSAGSDVPGCGGGGPHDYFDCLSELDEVFVTASMRSRQFIDDNPHGQPDYSRLDYDEDMDAAVFIFPPGSGNAKQLREQHEDVSSGNLLYYWETRWGAGWATDGPVDGIQRHKAFQLSSHSGAGGGGVYLEPRVEYNDGASPDVVGTVNVRTYQQDAPIAVEGGDRLGPQTGQFTIMAETWVRHWAYMDFDNNEFSYWVWAEGQELTQIHDRVFHHLDETMRSFWFEFNSSQDREGGDEIYIWGRNLVILRDLPSFGFAQQLIQEGAA